MLDLVTQSLGPLTCRVLQAKPGPPSCLVVLCHGYGAPGQDLVGLQALLAGQSAVARRARFVFPAGPVALGTAAQGGAEARAWWPLDLAYLARRAALGTDALAELRAHRFAELPRARRLLAATIEAALQGSNLAYERLVLGGFSQGAMLTCDLAFALEEACGALVLLSGTLIDEATWRRRAAQRAGLPVLLAHGRQDGVLPFAGAEALAQLLEEAKCDVQFLPTATGHTIAPEALAALATLLDARFG